MTVNKDSIKKRSIKTAKELKANFKWNKAQLAILDGFIEKGFFCSQYNILADIFNKVDACNGNVFDTFYLQADLIGKIKKRNLMFYSV